MLVDWDLNAEWTPERAAVARTIAWWYLRRHARGEFSDEIAAGVEYWMPDEARQLSVEERGDFLALFLAGGLARTRLYYLEPAAGDLAIQTGADVRTGRLPVSDPPAPYGLLVSPGGLGYTADGMQLIAAAWQPATAGWAVSWFIDSRDWFDVLIERKSITRTTPPRRSASSGSSATSTPHRWTPSPTTPPSNCWTRTQNTSSPAPTAPTPASPHTEPPPPCPGHGP